MTIFGLDGPTFDGNPIDPFLDGLTVPDAQKVSGDIDMYADVAVAVDLHTNLKGVSMWGFKRRPNENATSPGPLIEVAADDPLRVRWHNELGVQPTDSPEDAADKLPLETLIVDTTALPDGAPDPQNVLGSQPGNPQALVAMGVPVGWTSTHLHGAHSHPDADGFPDNMIADGNTQTSAYDNTYDNTDLNAGNGLGKVGAHLWYHDHAMNGTRFHVQAGLFGGYIVRDNREEQLGLPICRDTGELHLMLADRNVAKNPETGAIRLLHKTTPDTGEFFGPLTFVNGTVWPKLACRAQVLRLRLLNASNARTFRLHLVRAADDGTPEFADNLLRIIGTDGGLLHRAATVGHGNVQPPMQGAPALTLAPAERLDVLVDLSQEAGRALFLVNTAPAPYQGDQEQPDLADRPALADFLGHNGGDAANKNPYPWVMQFDVNDTANSQPGTDRAELDDIFTGGVLNPDFRRLVHNPTGAADPEEYVLTKHEHRIILLAETDPPGHLYLHELIEDPSGRIQLQLPGDPFPRTYRVEGWTAQDTRPSSDEASFYQQVGLRPLVGQWQVWKFVNATGDTHPIHIHQSQFQPLDDQAGLVVQQAGGVNLYDPTDRRTFIPIVPAQDQSVARTYDPQETLGWKDTIRIDPGNVVEVAIRFDLAGRYVYHCHVLEHEDTEMMRPLVVLPRAMPNMPGLPNMPRHTGH